MKQSSKVQSILLSAVQIPHELNYRDEDVYKQLSALKNDIATVGQTTPAALEKRDDGIHIPLQGFLRATALTELAAEGVINPRTNKVFDTIEAIVYSEMTDRDRYRLRFDHANRISLNRAEFQRAIEDGLRSQYTETEIVNQGRGLFQELYPPNRPIPVTGNDKIDNQAYLDYYRGVLQTAKRAWLAPDVLHDAWMNKLRGEHRWPTNSDLKQLVDVFTKECEGPGGNGYNRKTPGPKFLKAWSDYKKKIEDAELNGKAPKAASMMNHQQHEDLKKSTDSIIVKTAIDYIMRRNPADTYPLFDKFLVEKIESAMTEEIRQELLAFSTVTEEVASTEVETKIEETAK